MACFSCVLHLKWNRKEKRFMLCMDPKKKFFFNDHDQDNWFVISEVTNLGSYSSSHQGMCRAAPWEAVFYKQTDQDLCRKRWSKTAGLDTCVEQKRSKRRQLCFVRGTRRPPPHLASQPPRQLPKPQADHFLPQAHWCFETTDPQTAWTTKT